ncbi:MAG: BrnT family toxin [Steroidobacteraceae bacterium]
MLDRLLDESRTLGIKFILFLYPTKESVVGFEYDQDKRAANKDKHGLDCEEAQELWCDPDLLEIPARTTDEPRWLVIGKLGGTHGSAEITRRGDNIRLISVRGSRDEEVEACEGDEI